MMLSQGKQSKQSKGFPDNMRVWWNGRHAGLRTQGETHAGSKPVTRTICACHATEDIADLESERCGFESHHAYQISRGAASQKRGAASVLCQLSGEKINGSSAERHSVQIRAEASNDPVIARRPSGPRGNDTVIVTCCTDFFFTVFIRQLPGA